MREWAWWWRYWLATQAAKKASELFLEELEHCLGPRGRLVVCRLCECFEGKLVAPAVEGVRRMRCLLSLLCLLVVDAATVASQAWCFVDRVDCKVIQKLLV